MLEFKCTPKILYSISIYLVDLKDKLMQEKQSFHGPLKGSMVI